VLIVRERHEHMNHARLGLAGRNCRHTNEKNS
jgi:hypothetical protein